MISNTSSIQLMAPTHSLEKRVNDYMRPFHTATCQEHLIGALQQLPKSPTFPQEESTIREQVALRLLQEVIVMGAQEQEALDACLVACGPLEALSACATTLQEIAQKYNQKSSKKKKRAASSVESPSILETALRTIRRWLVKGVSFPPDYDPTNGYEERCWVEQVTLTLSSHLSRYNTNNQHYNYNYNQQQQNAQSARNQEYLSPIIQACLESLTKLVLLFPVQISNACHALAVQLPTWAIGSRYNPRLIEGAISMALYQQEIEGSSYSASYFKLLVQHMVRSRNPDDVALGLYKYHERHYRSHDSTNSTSSTQHQQPKALCHLLLQLHRQTLSPRESAQLLRSVTISSIPRQSHATKIATTQLTELWQRHLYPYMELSCRPILVASRRVREAFVRLLVLSPSSVLNEEWPDRLLCHCVASLLANPAPLLTKKKSDKTRSTADSEGSSTTSSSEEDSSSSEDSSSGEEDLDSDSEDSIEGALQHHAWLAKHVQEVIATWSLAVFVRQTDHRLQRHVTNFLLSGMCFLQLQQDDTNNNSTSHHNNNHKNAPHMSELVAGLLEGVTVRLESSIPAIRKDGMMIAERLAQKMGQELQFDELDQERSLMDDDEVTFLQSVMTASEFPSHYCTTAVGRKKQKQKASQLLQQRMEEKAAQHEKRREQPQSQHQQRKSNKKSAKKKEKEERRKRRKAKREGKSDTRILDAVYGNVKSPNSKRGNRRNPRDSYEDSTQYQPDESTAEQHAEQHEPIRSPRTPPQAGTASFQLPNLLQSKHNSPTRHHSPTRHQSPTRHRQNQGAKTPPKSALKDKRRRHSPSPRQTTHHEEEQMQPQQVQQQQRQQQSKYDSYDNSTMQQEDNQVNDSVMAHVGPPRQPQHQQPPEQTAAYFHDQQHFLQQQQQIQLPPQHSQAVQQYHGTPQQVQLQTPMMQPVPPQQQPAGNLHQQLEFHNQQQEQEQYHPEEQHQPQVHMGMQLPPIEYQPRHDFQYDEQIQYQYDDHQPHAMEMQAQGYTPRHSNAAVHRFSHEEDPSFPSQQDYHGGADETYATSEQPIMLHDRRQELHPSIKHTYHGQGDDVDTHRTSYNGGITKHVSWDHTLDRTDYVIPAPEEVRQEMYWQNQLKNQRRQKHYKQQEEVQERLQRQRQHEQRMKEKEKEREEQITMRIASSPTPSFKDSATQSLISRDPPEQYPSTPRRRRDEQRGRPQTPIVVTTVDDREDNDDDDEGVAACWTQQEVEMVLEKDPPKHSALSPLPTTLGPHSGSPRKSPGNDNMARPPANPRRNDPPEMPSSSSEKASGVPSLIFAMVEEEEQDGNKETKEAMEPDSSDSNNKWGVDKKETIEDDSLFAMEHKRFKEKQLATGKPPLSPRSRFGYQQQAPKPRKGVNPHKQSSLSSSATNNHKDSFATSVRTRSHPSVDPAEIDARILAAAYEQESLPSESSAPSLSIYSSTSTGFSLALNGEQEAPEASQRATRQPKQAYSKAFEHIKRKQQNRRNKEDPHKHRSPIIFDGRTSKSPDKRVLIVDPDAAYVSEDDEEEEDDVNYDGTFEDDDDYYDEEDESRSTDDEEEYTDDVSYTDDYDDDDSEWDESEQRHLDTYDVEDDEEDLRETPQPRYLRDCLELLRAPDSDKEAYSKHEAALTYLPRLIKAKEKPADLPDLAVPLALELMRLENKYNLDSFEDDRLIAVIALTVAEPLAVGQRLILLLWEDIAFMDRLDGLTILSEAAFELSGNKKLEQWNKKMANNRRNDDGNSHGKRAYVKENYSLVSNKDNSTMTGEDMGSIVSVHAERALGQVESKTRRWGRGRRQPETHALRSRFGPVAHVWYYSLVGGFLQRKDNAALWGGAVGARLLANLFVTLATIVECAGVAPGTDVLAKDMFELVWSFRTVDVAEVRMAVLVAIAASLSCLPEDVVLTMMFDGPFSSLPEGLKQMSQLDPDQSCRRLASSMSKGISGIVDSLQPVGKVTKLSLSM